MVFLPSVNQIKRQRARPGYDDGDGEGVIDQVLKVHVQSSEMN
jgi:hypothetical protein